MAQKYGPSTNRMKKIVLNQLLVPIFYNTGIPRLERFQLVGPIFYLVWFTNHTNNAILVLNQCSISAVFQIVRFAGDQKTALSGDSL